MIALLQRVRRASVTVENHTIAAIGLGILVFVGIEKTDDRRSCRRMLERILAYRVFASPESQQMNRSVVDVDGDVLLVPQFTLVANTNKGTRASFSSACPPAQAAPLFASMVADCHSLHHKTAAGRFAAAMQIESLNDGPVNFILRSSPS